MLSNPTNICIIIFVFISRKGYMSDEPHPLIGKFLNGHLQMEVEPVLQSATRAVDTMTCTDVRHAYALPHTKSTFFFRLWKQSRESYYKQILLYQASAGQRGYSTLLLYFQRFVPTNAALYPDTNATVSIMPASPSLLLWLGDCLYNITVKCVLCGTDGHLLGLAWHM